MIDACHREVLGLHEFFVGWFTGFLEDTDEAFARVAQALAPEFVLIDPTGHARRRDALLASIRDAHGRHPEFGIEIRNFHERHEAGDLAVVVYEEHQVIGDRANGRISTALFWRSDAAPEGVCWIHLHETALPAD